MARLLFLGAVPSSALRREPACFPRVPASASGGVQLEVAPSDFLVSAIACSEIGTLVCLSGAEALGCSLCVVRVGGQQWTAPLRRGSPHPPVGLGALLVLPRGRGVPQSRASV